VRLEDLGQLKIIHVIGSRTRDLPACSIVPQPSTLPRAPEGMITIIIIVPLLYALRNESLGPRSLHDEELLKLAADKVSFIFMSVARKLTTHGICQILTILCSLGKLSIKKLGSAVYEHHQLRL
jgi:hypothetical protein